MGSSRPPHEICCHSQSVAKQQRSLSCCRVVLLSALLAIALVLLCDVDGHFAVVSFVRWYGNRFVKYYAPKVDFVNSALRRAADYLPEVPTDVYEAWDLSTVLVVVVSVFHLIERIRIAVLAKIQSGHVFEIDAHLIDAQ